MERKPQLSTKGKIMLSQGKDMRRMKKDVLIMFLTSGKQKERKLNYKWNSKR